VGPCSICWQAGRDWKAISTRAQDSNGKLHDDNHSFTTNTNEHNIFSMTFFHLTNHKRRYGVEAKPAAEFEQ